LVGNDIELKYSVTCDIVCILISLSLSLFYRMSEAVQNQTDLLVDDELRNLMREYSIPHVADLGQDSILSQSQYAKVRCIMNIV